MKKIFSLTVMLLFISTISFASSAVEAEPVQQAVSERCQLAQQKLSGPVRSRDLRTRVDRMQAYLYVYERLDVFTKRLEYNSQPYATQMREHVDSLGVAIDAFKSNYEAYDLARTNTAELNNCSAKTDTFIETLTSARGLRSTVNQDVVTIHTILSGPVTNTLNDLSTSLDASGITGAAN